MAVTCELSCLKMNQQLEVSLSDSFDSMSSNNINNSALIYEDGSYRISFFCDQYEKSSVKEVGVCVNGQPIGELQFEDNLYISGRVIYNESVMYDKPFLLHYDLLLLSFILHFPDGNTKEYYSNYMLCISKNPVDSDNIQRMLQELSSFDDTQVCEWLFSNNSFTNYNISFHEGSWNKHTYRSLNSYIQLLEQIITCYKENFAYFRMQSKHTLQQFYSLVPFEQVKEITHDSFSWIMQNAEQLAKTANKSSIRYNGQNYLPYRIKTPSHRKSLNVYENRVVVGFIYTVLTHAKRIFSDFSSDILNEEKIVSRIHGSFPTDYSAPIITIKSLQIAFNRVLLNRLDLVINQLNHVYSLYASFFEISVGFVSSLPRKTSTFCEVKPYIQIFNIIVQWFQYGEYSLEKERLILQIKTLDKLFEYYCLLRLLKLFADNGYKTALIERPTYKYTYASADKYYTNETDVPNTFILSKNNTTATIYYQPVISSTQFENNLSLFRTTKPFFTDSPDYYTPDFVVKISSEAGREEYLIFDSKFSSRYNIRKNRLPEVIRKYSCEIAIANNTLAPKMVWILQGRIKNNENPIWHYHNSQLAQEYGTITSYGIASINTSDSFCKRLWQEIQQCVAQAI